MNNLPENNVTLREADVMLASAKDLLILTHEHPDGDTLGCAFALKRAYGCEDRRVEVACCDPVRPGLRFITGSERLDVPDGFDPDVVCAVDAASAGMLGDLYDRFGGDILLKLDHHRTSDPYARYNYVDAGAAACGEIIYRMLKDAGRLGPEVCGALYAAVASDTGCFKFANTTADSHVICADLIARGADCHYINAKLFEQRTPGEIAAARLAYGGLKFFENGRIASVGFTNAMKEEYGFDDDDVAAYHNLPREIMGVEVGVTIRQQPDDPGEYKVSLRSSGEPDCSAICGLFGGGGHKGAAGCRIKASSLEEAENVIVSAAARSLG